ncbi:MAG: hypothetical protein IPN82_08370 [Chitinophagaceae bacterium]|nr:hypothetical protein [Chitinophagaceae bacterium]MBK8606827.1 hypothetical protein [Chitinophagaceae bacterium]MBP6478669.1 hypothetical protein [Chitinophagaceae bacterium]MBP7109416.1 hypothetical protein [Chitinophagaceae bacterium]
MRLQSIFRLSLFAFVAIGFFSCNEKDDFTIETADTYMPLAVGKYITYRVDSMVFVNFGKDTEIRSYQIKHRVDAIITDAEGRPAYRIYRSLRDVAGLQPWQEVGSYTVTTLSDQIEVTENNLRFIKLHSPVRFGFSWKGNKYFPDNPYNAAYNFSNDDNIEDWEYSYDELSSFSYGGINYTDVQTVEQIDEAFNVPITSPTSYAAKSRGVERYSKNIGLIYREYELWEYQPNTGNPAGPYKTGFGITMWMIDHN